MNITTASAWKNFRLALRLNVGTCLSAASSRSVATLAPFAKRGRLDKLGKSGRLGRLDRLGRLGRLGRLERLGKFCRLGRFGKPEKLMPRGPVVSRLPLCTECNGAGH